MSDKPISVGDLVMVVRVGFHGTGTLLGRVFRVASLVNRSYACSECGLVHFANSPSALCEEEDGWFRLALLKRLDPDALKDDVPTKDELNA